MRRMMVAGNWKMNGSRSEAGELVRGIVSHSNEVQAELVVFPPSVYLACMSNWVSERSLDYGAQNVSEFESGAYTGEVSVAMLQDVGCRYVIVGHSERRSLFRESNEVVAAKFHAAISAGIKPILCVGESLKQRQEGKTLEIVQEQLAVVLSLHDNPSALRGAVIAYEPVWAIGTGLTATPEQAQEVHAAIRQQLAGFDAELASSIRLLYGGSVKPGNAKALFEQDDVDGALVGGASLDVEQFISIGKSCNS